MVIAAIVIVIISKGIPNNPIIPKIKKAAIKFGTTPIKDNLMFLKSTKNIKNILRNNNFSNELFYELDMYNIYTLPLRERAEDINQLIIRYEYFYSTTVFQYWQLSSFLACFNNMLT